MQKSKNFHRKGAKIAKNNLNFFALRKLSVLGVFAVYFSAWFRFVPVMLLEFILTFTNHIRICEAEK